MGYPKITVEAMRTIVCSAGSMCTEPWTLNSLRLVCIHPVYSSLKMNRRQTYGPVLELVAPRSFRTGQNFHFFAII
jgi:hypothetical protein